MDGNVQLNGNLRQTALDFEGWHGSIARRQVRVASASSPDRAAGDNDISRAEYILRSGNCQTLLGSHDDPAHNYPDPQTFNQLRCYNLGCDSPVSGSRQETILMPNSMWTRRIHEPFIAAALLIALTAGFGYAALLAAALALRIPLGTWWGAAVQAHGHAQLFGWMGLFILGMGLYFLPKLRGTKLKQTQYAPWGLGLLASGILLHSLAQPAISFVQFDSPLRDILRGLWLVSALLELGGMLLLARMLVATELGSGRLSREAPAYPVLPFLGLAAFSAALAFISGFIGTLLAVSEQQAIVPAEWDSLVIQLMLYGLAIPAAFVLSVRNLPLFLRLAMPPLAGLRPLALAYALGLALRLSPSIAMILNFDSAPLSLVGALGVIIQGLAVLVFVWMIDLLRRRPPWVVYRAPNTRPDLDYLRKPTRRNYPDAGEYSRFELLIYSAYAWLVVSAGMGIIRSIGLLVGNAALIPLDGERHTLTLGFITLLIFGMAARMMPGFSGKRRVAFAPLVMTTFLLGNLTVLLRVVPLFLPATTLSMALFGSSGAVGWIAVAALTVNLAATVRL